MNVFLDTSFFIKLFMGEERAKKLFEKIKEEKLYTSINVIEETSYILMKYLAKTKTGKERHFEILKEIKENENLFNKCMEKLKEFYEALHNTVIILEKLPSWILVLEIMEKYRLLPNDALIAATCKYYGISKIATFDEDFEKVDFLEVVKV